MHDHNRLNYNDKYSFDNIECNQHLQRDCQKNSDDTCHKWSKDLKDFISYTIKDRKDVMDRGASAFDDRLVTCSGKVRCSVCSYIMYRIRKKKTYNEYQKRDGFSQMIEYVLKGKIDLIITKSISRFVGNMVDSLTCLIYM